MPEKKELIKSIHTKMMCKCGGEMQVKQNYGKHTIIYDKGETKILHVCTKCHRSEFYSKMYTYDEPLEE